MDPENLETGNENPQETGEKLPASSDNAADTEQVAGAAGEAPKKSDAVQKRINKLTRERYELRAQNQALEQRLAALERNVAPKQEAPTSAPQLKDFNDFDEYVSARAKWEAGNIVAERDKQASERNEKSKQQESEAELQKQWTAKMAKLTEEIDDFEDVMADADVPITQDIARAIMEADNGPEVMYFLAKNPEKVEQMHGKSPATIGRIIGRIEAEIEAGKAKPAPAQAAGPGGEVEDPAPAPKSKAPVPLKQPSSGSAKASGDAPSDDDDINDWMRKERARMNKRAANRGARFV